MLKKTLTSLVAVAMLSGVAFADKLADVKSAGVLKAGVKYDFKPFGFVNEKNKVVGFDIDLMNYIAKDLGVKLKLQQVTSKTRIALVATGAIDIAAASMTHKVQRDDTIDFTISYFFDGQAMLVRKDNKKRTPQGFAGKKVGAIQGATSGDNFLKVVPTAKIIKFQEYPQAVMALHKKKIDAVTTDLVWCTAQAKDSHGKLKVIPKTISFEPYGMGIPENESNFRDAVNFALQKAVKDGYYAKSYKKWFGENPKVIPEVWP